ncbi:MAG: FAD-dependent oxidoreductase [Chloroflexi bacterium]|nr:FAD-dependent oxidoreductase [Chloroflexota bacterium]
MSSDKLGNVIETDVLVVGSGIAGALAAIKARQAGVEVVVADRATSGRSGASSMASGVFHHFHPQEDNIEDAIKEGSLGRTYLADQLVSARALPETYRRLEEMAGWGVHFEKKDNRLVRVKGHGNIATRVAVLSGSGGQLMSALAAQVQRAGARVMNRLLICDLLTSDGQLPTTGKVVGAIGLDTATGDIYVVRSKATILCCGAWKLPYAEHVPHYQGGDGHAMALRAGAAMTGLDLSKVRGVRPVYAMVGSTINIIMGQGAIMTNRPGERYMEKYDPLRKEQTERWLLTAATLKEIREGRGPIGLDMTHFTPEQVRLVRAAVPLVIARVEAAGKDITRDKLEYTVWTYPILQTGEGGTKVNERGETSIPGLYAAGDDSDNAGSFVGALPGGAVVGAWAGESAGRSTSGVPLPEINTEQARALTETILAPLRVRDGPTYDDAWKKSEVIAREGIGLVKHEERLTKAVADIERMLAEDLPRTPARDPADLARVHTLRNFLEVARAVCIAGIHRRETRGASLREDFPETDNKNWLKHIIARNAGGRIEITCSPLASDGYPCPPPRIKFDQLRLFSGVSSYDGILDKAVRLDG